MIILVTGLMRSGTSLVSKQLHELGVPMGTTMSFPFPGEHGQLDYEDAEFSTRCLAAIRGEEDLGSLHSFFQEYARKRGEGVTVWGVKSPYLLPYVDLFKRMAPDEVKVIRTTRNVAATYKSLERQLGEFATPEQLAGVKRFQDKLRNYEVDADLTIDITESWLSPDTVRDKLKELINA